MTDDFSEVENSPLWRAEEFMPIILNKEQYESLKRGFNPDWEFRYEPHFINGWHYFSRSCFWVKKFRFEYDEHYDIYMLVESYSTDAEYGRPLLAESFCSGYYEPRIWTPEEAKEFWFEYNETMCEPIKVKRKPVKCHKCGQKTVVEIVYGMPSSELLEAAERKEVILGGCCVHIDPSDPLKRLDPEWECKECGQRYKKE